VADNSGFSGGEMIQIFKDLYDYIFYKYKIIKKVESLGLKVNNVLYVKNIEISIMGEGFSDNKTLTYRLGGKTFKEIFELIN